MLEFDAFRQGEVTLDELIEGLGPGELANLTHEMIDAMLVRMRDCEDGDVTLEPLDPEAHDPYAADPADVALAWNLGHVIVHVTASAEESAFLAAELARGVENHGRSRYEVPWQSMTSIAGCRKRLEESRRMRVASLDMWPGAPFLDNRYRPWEEAPDINAVGQFVLGLMHDDSHLDQIDEIVRQAKEARR